MKILFFTFSLFYFSLNSSYSKPLPFDRYQFEIESTQLTNDYKLTDTLGTNKEKTVYQIICSGIENDIRNYFRHITYDALIKSDSNLVVKALNKIGPNERVTHTIWIMEEVKNRNLDVRNYVYSKLLEVDYKKPNFMVKTLINNYFTNLREPDDNLAKKVSELQKRMNK